MQGRVITFLGHGNEQPGNSRRRQQSAQDGLQYCNTSMRRNKAGDDGKQTASELCKDKDESQSGGLNSRRKELRTNRDALMLSVIAIVEGELKQHTVAK